MLAGLRIIALLLVSVIGVTGSPAQQIPPDIPSGNSNVTFGEVTPSDGIPEGYRINAEGQLVLINPPPPDTSMIEMPPLAPSAVAAIADEVKACFDGGMTSPQQLFDCSGYWVTPHALVLCSLGERCPVIDGNVAGARSIATELLASEGLDRFTSMKIDVGLLELPDAENIAGCAAGASPQASVACAVTTLAPQHQGLIDCGGTSDMQDRAECLLEAAGVSNADEMSECLRKFDASSPECASFVSDDARRLNALSECNLQAGSSKIECLMSASGPGILVAYRCAVTASQGELPTECLRDSFTPEQVAALDCAARFGMDASAVSLCVAAALAGGSEDVSKALACAQADDPARCLLQDDAAALAAYDCARAEGSATQRALVCAGGLADPTTRTAVQCLAEGNGDPGATAICAAAAFLPPELQKLANCASTSSGYISAAICLGGLNMNEEWRIAAECAANSGGEPLTFGTCTAGQLTVRELTKCFSSNLTDCFGPSNTLVVALNNAYNDLVYGPSDSNDAVRFFRDIGDTARSLGIPAPGSTEEIAFCAAFPAACIVQQLPNVSIPTTEQIWGDGDFNPF